MVKHTQYDGSSRRHTRWGGGPAALQHLRILVNLARFKIFFGQIWAKFIFLVFSIGVLGNYSIFFSGKKGQPPPPHAQVAQYAYESYIKLGEHFRFTKIPLIWNICHLKYHFWIFEVLILLQADWPVKIKVHRNPRAIFHMVKTQNLDILENLKYYPDLILLLTS